MACYKWGLFVMTTVPGIMNPIFSDYSTCTKALQAASDAVGIANTIDSAPAGDPADGLQDEMKNADSLNASVDAEVAESSSLAFITPQTLTWKATMRHAVYSYGGAFATDSVSAISENQIKSLKTEFYDRMVGGLLSNCWISESVFVFKASPDPLSNGVAASTIKLGTPDGDSWACNSPRYEFE
ncbi:uncharacterized protein N7482_005902 [Penicillium canariense]|uniref:Uncharacterized protein n=1 Tax=Penicillium canariense TaxID=189055 RepID=A0A9W9I3E2_9EURO|nr:uncharacterized protein N7482_005902 [Penicillium canariense]KAJ5167121.1 hypothetical protein N7482_005902 [Penicillium canariense]